MTRKELEKKLGETVDGSWDIQPAILSLLDTYIKEMLEDVIGPSVQPMMGGKEIPRGKTVTIDMENNLRESCKFIEDNAKFMMQQDQRQRASKYLSPINQRKE